MVSDSSDHSTGECNAELTTEDYGGHDEPRESEPGTRRPDPTPLTPTYPT